MMTMYVGIDVSKRSLDIGVLDGPQREHARFSNDRAGYVKLLRFLKKRRKTAQVCLEATGSYGDGVAEYLYEAAYRVSVVNPARIKGYAQSQLSRNKTDKLDAYLIADFCRTQQPEAWSPPAPEIRQLLALVRHLEDLEQSRSQWTNRLSTAKPGGPVVAQVQAQLALLEEQITQIKQAIQHHIDLHPDLKRQRDLLASIPGIGDLTAGKLLAEFRTIADFANVRQLVAFAGLNPRHHTSGSSIHKATRISKCGRASLRAALYLPAVVAKNHNPILTAFVLRLQARGLSGKQLIVAIMRKLLHLAYGVLKSGRPFDPNFISLPA
jgi:transposase